MLVATLKEPQSLTETYVQSETISYYIAEHGIGKTLETIRQAISRDDLIVAPWESPYKQYGFSEFEKEGKQKYKVTYMSLAQLRNIKTPIAPEGTYTEKHPLQISVDEGKVMLEELLRERLGVPVKINFMSLDANSKEMEEEEFDE